MAKGTAEAGPKATCSTSRKVTIRSLKFRSSRQNGVSKGQRLHIADALVHWAFGGQHPFAGFDITSTVSEDLGRSLQSTNRTGGPFVLGDLLLVGSMFVGEVPKKEKVIFAYNHGSPSLPNHGLSRALVQPQ